MSGKTVTIEFNEKRQKFWLSHGNETFYDENREWIMFETEKEAEEWVKLNHPDLILQ